MKKAIKTILWIFSLMFLLMSLLMLIVSVLSCAMMLGCAVLLNPLFIERVPLKKGMTALLVIGLFIGSIAVVPPKETDPPQRAVENAEEIRQITKEPTATNDELRIIPNNASPVQNPDTIMLTPSVSPTMSPTPTATPTPVPTATPTPAPTDTPKPTGKPTPTPSPVTKAAPVTRLAGITILDYSDSVSRGSYAFIKIQGAPNTDYDCEVEYKSGMSEASGLGVKRSDGNGIVSWKWKVGSRTSLDYTPTIYIDGGGDSVSVDFEVTK